MTLFLIMLWAYACLVFFTHRPATIFVFCFPVLLLAAVGGACGYIRDAVVWIIESLAESNL